MRCGEFCENAIEGCTAAGCDGVGEPLRSWTGCHGGCEGLSANRGRGWKRCYGVRCRGGLACAMSWQQSSDAILFIQLAEKHITDELYWQIVVEID